MFTASSGAAGGTGQDREAAGRQCCVRAPTSACVTEVGRGAARGSGTERGSSAAGPPWAEPPSLPAAGGPGQRRLQVGEPGGEEAPCRRPRGPAAWTSCWSSSWWLSECCGRSCWPRPSGWCGPKRKVWRGRCAWSPGRAAAWAASSPWSSPGAGRCWCCGTSTRRATRRRRAWCGTSTGRWPRRRPPPPPEVSGGLPALSPPPSPLTCPAPARGRGSRGYAAGGSSPEQRSPAAGPGSGSALEPAGRRAVSRPDGAVAGQSRPCARSGERWPASRSLGLQQRR